MRQNELLLYGGGEGDSILSRMALLAGGRILEQPQQRTRDLFTELRRLLQLAARFSFRGSVWHNYIALYLLTHENPFSLLCERQDPSGTLLHMAERDFRILRRMFDFDFAPLEAALGTGCLAMMEDFQSPEEGDEAGELVRDLTARLERTKDAAGMLRETVASYREYGVGLLALYRAFRYGDGKLRPVRFPDTVALDDIVGYEAQKQALRANTEAFLAGHAANNVLLYGDSGTGKSTCIRALLREYGDEDLRMVEVHRYQFRELFDLMELLRERRHRFILMLDDLSFEEDETEYKFLKAVIEGGIEARPENVLLYATSNRRHLIRESWSDRSDMEHNGDIHRSDTMEEKLSLAERFGVAIRFDTPARQEYHDIVESLAQRYGVTAPTGEELLRQADEWEIRHGGVSGRTAEQFILALAGREDSAGEQDGK